MAEWHNSIGRPCHYVAVDRANHSIVLSIRWAGKIVVPSHATCQLLCIEVTEDVAALQPRETTIICMHLAN